MNGEGRPMSHTIVLHLTDEDYAPIEREAAATGRTPAEIIVAQLRERASRSNGQRQQSAQPEPAPAASAGESASSITHELAQASIAATARQMAAESGRPAEESLAELKARLRPKARPPLSEAERQAAWQRLRRHFGAVDSGDPRSADNERLDADLAREYGRGLDRDE
jgi:hypothetical protein